MKNPFNQNAEPKNRLSLADVQDISVTVNVKLLEIKRLENPAERMKQLDALHGEMLKIYNDGEPKVTDKKSFLTGLGVGTAASAALTLTAVSAGAIFVPWMTLPAAGIWAATHLGIGTAAGAGIGGFWGNRKERNRLKKKYGSVEVAEGLHKVVATIEAEIDREKFSMNSIQERLSDAFKPAVDPAVNDNAVKKPEEKAPEKPRPKRQMGQYKDLKKGPYGK